MGSLLASTEVRWFLDKTKDNTAILIDWIENNSPYGDAGQRRRT